MKKIYLLFLTFIFAAGAFCQSSSANYAFSTAANGSLVDMSSGTTQLLGAVQDDAASPLTAIGFDYFFMGVRYTQFSVNSNGYIRLGGVVAGAQYTLASTAATTLITAFGSDLITSTTGKIHYKLIGTAPNRQLVIEFKNETIIYDGAGATPDGTYQVMLSEGSDNLQFTYGNMNRNSSTGFGGSMDLQYIGFSTSTAVANNFATVTNATNAVSTTAVTSNQNTLSAPIVNLTSSADGSRRIYSFANVPTAAPSGLNFTNVTTGSTTLNWTDNSTDETGFAIFRSDDGGLTYNYVTTTAANAVTYTATGLAPNTTYFWQVKAIREGESAPASGSQLTLTPGSITSNGTGGGLWSQTTTWTGGVVPTISDNVLIQNGDAVTIDITASAFSLTVGQGTSGSLTFENATARDLTILTDLTIAAAGSFTSGAGALTTHSVTLGGNLLNNGVFDLALGTSGASLTFNGSQNSSFTGSGGTNNLFTLVPAKAARAQVIEITLPNFSVRGLSAAATGGLLTSATGTGTVKFSGTNTFSGQLWNVAAYNIPATMGVWINNPNFTVTPLNGSSTLAGLFRMSAGTFNIGTATGNSMAFSAGAVITVEGGAINAAGRFGVAAAATAVTYTQTAGTITVCTAGNASTTLGSFDLGTTTLSTINISGGTIIIQLAATTIDYRNQAGAGNPGVTGGLLQLGNAASGAAKAFTVRGVVPNLLLTNTSANHTATFGAPVTYNNISLNVTVSAGTTLNFGNAVFLFAGTVITNNGTIIHNGASSNFVLFATTAPVSYTGTGTVTAPLTALGIQSDMGFTIDPASSNIVVTAVRLFSGSVTNANKITVGNGGATTGTVQIGNTVAPTAAGTFDVPLTFNAGTGGIILSELRTTMVNRTILNELPPSRTLTTFSVDDNDASHKFTLSPGNVSISTGATPTFTFTNGRIDLNGNTLTLGLNATTAALAGTQTTGATTAYLYNGLYKRFISATTGNRDFPMGNGVAKKNASINFTTAPTAGSLTARWSSLPPNFPNAAPLMEGSLVVNTAASQGSWFIDAADGLTDGIYTGTFIAYGSTDVIDYTKTVLIKRPTAGGDWTLDGTHVTTTGSNAAPVLQRTGMVGFSEFAIGGEAAIVLPVSIEFFRGSKQSFGNYLDWKVTCTSAPSVVLSLERSADGISFSEIHNENATAVRCQQAFNYTDSKPLAGVNHYRLKITSPNGFYRYSTVITLVNDTKGFDLYNIAPNPAQANTMITIQSEKAGRVEISVSDLSGKIITKMSAGVIAGSNAISMDVSKFAAGSYQVLVMNESGEIKTKRFVKF